MHYSFSCDHELQISGSNRAFVASEVFMIGTAGKKVYDCFLTPVRVVGEAGAGGDGEVVEHEEGSEVSELDCVDGVRT